MVEMYWSRIPGKLVDKLTGKDTPDWIRWNGSAREWNELLMEVIWDVSNSLLNLEGLRPEVVRRLILVVGHEVAGIMRASVICGKRAGGGVVLTPDERYESSDEVSFVDPTTGEVHGIVHVMDLGAAQCLDE